MIELPSPEPHFARKSREGRSGRTVGEELEELERTNPEVKKAKQRLNDVADRILGRGPALSFDDVRSIYGDQTWRGKSSS